MRRPLSSARPSGEDGEQYAWTRLCVFEIRDGRIASLCEFEARRRGSRIRLRRGAGASSRTALAWRHDDPGPKLQLTDDEWRKKLKPEEFHVLREAGTERPFTGEYTDTKTEGVYECRACGAELFRSSEKFESHCGWPSFFDPANSDAVILRSDDTMGMRRVEVICANCHSHLGHVFEGEGYPTPTDQRYCINSISLRLVPEPSSTRTLPGRRRIRLGQRCRRRTGRATAPSSHCRSSK